MVFFFDFLRFYFHLPKVITKNGNFKTREAVFHRVNGRGKGKEESGETLTGEARNTVSQPCL